MKGLSTTKISYSIKKPLKLNVNVIKKVKKKNPQNLYRSVLYMSSLSSIHQIHELKLVYFLTTKFLKQQAIYIEYFKNIYNR